MSMNLFGSGNDEKNKESENPGNPLSTDSREHEKWDETRINKVMNGEGQKMDSVHPDELKPDREDAILEEERDSD